MSSEKILVISNSNFPGTTGDSANYLEMIKGLRRRGFRIVLACPKYKNSKSFDKKMRKQGIQIIRVPFSPPRLAEIGEKQIFMSSVLRLTLFYLAEFFTILAIILENETKHVIVRHCIQTVNLLPLLGVLRMKITADGDILSSSSMFHVPKSLLRIITIYERVVLRLYTHFLAATPSQMRLLAKYGFRKSQLVLKGIGIDTKKVPVHSLEGIHKDTFGFFGALEKWQHVDDLLRAWAKVIAKKPGARLFIIGDGSMKDYLKELAVDLKVTHSTVFLDGVPRETLWNEYFRLFRVVIIPRSLKLFPEDFPIKLSEALAAGKPVIASKIPSISSVVNEEEGVIFTEPDNEESLALGICQLIDNDQRIRALSRQALETSRRFNLDSQLDKLVEILTSKNQN